jgi:uncharacterized membrane protein YdcZ (DUF606 family)
MRERPVSSEREKNITGGGSRVRARASALAALALAAGLLLKNHVGRVVGELRELVDAVRLDALVAVHGAVTQQLVSLLLCPVDATGEAETKHLLLELPGALDGALVRVPQHAVPLLRRVGAVPDVDGGVCVVHAQLGAAAVLDLVRRHVEEAAQSFQFLLVVAHFERVVLDEVEHGLVVVAEAHVQKVRVVEDGRDDVLDDHVDALDDADERATRDARDHDAFAEDALAGCYSRQKVARFGLQLEKRLGDEAELLELLVDFLGDALQAGDDAELRHQLRRGDHRARSVH